MKHYEHTGQEAGLPGSKEKPAIIMAAFGSSTGAMAAMEPFSKRVREEFAGHNIFQACTSGIIRRKLGLPGLEETLERVKSQGFRKAVVQPLYIFPGSMYIQLSETCSAFPGMRIIAGETLLHRWKFVKDVLRVLERDFLPPGHGINILALHGSSHAANPANTVYLGLEQMARGLYPNVFAASVEGVPDRDAVMEKIRRGLVRSEAGRARIIPVMYLAGFHAVNDLMGKQGSWRSTLEEMGFSVDIPMTEHEGSLYYKGLAWYPEIADFFMRRLRSALDLA
jgi:sirohydrochlorin cobaltochelatase